MSAAMRGHEAMADADLVRHVLRGDRNTYAELVRRHQDVIYRHMRGMGLDHDTALDLVQDAFVRAYDRLSECRDHDRFRAWLFRIARNLCLDHVKSVRRLTVPFSSVDGIDRVEDDRRVPGELDFMLRSALDRLPATLREAFLLKHDAGYTYDELAEITQVTPSAAKMRVHRARETLRDFLAKQGVNAA